MTLSEAIQNRILELLESKKMNVNQLAIKAGLNPATIRSILKSRCKTPNMTTLYYICIGFEITLSEFYNSKLFNTDNINDD
jgi:transcriptional regulator with XRE-family HTH domain